MALLDLQPRIAELEKDLGISREILAQALEVNPRTVTRWHDEGRLPGGENRKRFNQMWDLREMLCAMFPNREVIHGWMNSPSMYLGGLTPTDALKAGRIDRVRADLDGIAGGIYL